MPRKRKAAPAEIFVSHSSANAKFTTNLANVLNRHGIGTFVSKANIRGAQQWHDEIGAALKRCNWFILVLSPQSVRSRWVKHELLYALQENRFRDRIIPIVYKTCDADALSWTLSAIEWVDFRKNFDDGCQDLLRVWAKKYTPG